MRLPIYYLEVTVTVNLSHSLDIYAKRPRNHDDVNSAYMQSTFISKDWLFLYSYIAIYVT